MVRKDGKVKKVDKRKGKNGKMTSKEELFKNEYLLNGFNATRAYMKVNKEENVNVAGVRGFQLLRKYNIMSAIDKVLTQTFHKLEVSNEMVIASYVNQAFYDERAYFDEDDIFVGMNNLNIVQQACIESVDIEKKYDKDGEYIGTKTKVKFYSRKAALDSLARYKGLIRGDGNTFIFNDNRKIDTKIIAAKELKEALGADRTTELNKFLTTEAEGQEA